MAAVVEMRSISEWRASNYHENKFNKLFQLTTIPLELLRRFPSIQMHLSFIIRALVVLCISFILRDLYLFAGNSSGKMVQKFIYPEARRDESVVEDHFGTKVCKRAGYSFGVLVLCKYKGKLK